LPAADQLLSSGFGVFLVCGSARSADLRRREHPQEVCGKRSAGVPVLQTDDVPVRGVELAKTKVGFLGDDDRGIVILESQPGDVSLLVVVAVDLHRVEG
jgi:hypothetical protein